MSLAYLTQSAEDHARDAASAYPEDEAGWESRYQFLWDAYIGKDYSAEIIKLWHLFRAIDDSNCEIDRTYRVFRDFPFLVGTYAQSVVGGHPGPVLEVDRGAPKGLLTPGETVWRRSGTRVRVGEHAKMASAMGNGGWEVVRMNRTKPYDVQLVWRDARVYRALYDETGTRLRKVIIQVGYITDQDERRLHGLTDSPAIHTYRKVLTPERVEVYRDEQLSEAESGEHGLGVVPFAQATWVPWTEPERGLPSGHPIDRAIAVMDSVLCMARAAGNRSAAPIIVVKGAKLASNEMGRVGRIYHGLPPEASMEVLEADLSAISQMLDVVKELHTHVEKTEPAYIFADSNAQESGEAKGYRAAAYESAVMDIRGRFFGALREATAMAVAAEEGRAHDYGEPAFCVDLPPVLPRSVHADVRAYVEIRQDLKVVDRVRTLQRLGFIPAEEDPEAYARTVQEESADRAAQFLGEAPPPRDPEAAP